MPRFAVAVLCSLATSSRVAEDALVDPTAIRAVTVGAVRFDYAVWTNQSEKDIASAKENEAAWSKQIAEEVTERAGKRGLGGGDGARRLDITIVNLDPGSRAARQWVGMGAGAGVIAAKVEIEGHGSFRIDSKITGGAWGGNFRGVLAELGEEIVDHLADRREGGK
jgi:hypothetical protein